MSNALKSRAEVQLWSALNQNKPRSASAYLNEQQQQQIEEEGDPETSFPGGSDHAGQENQRQRRHHAAQRVKPPSEHDMMIAEVRQLNDICFTGQENDSKLNLYEDDDPTESHTQIELNAIRRRDEHMAALAQYASTVKEISEEIEVRLIQTADKVKDDLAELDKRLGVSERALEDEALLLSSTNEDILYMRVQIEAICAERTQLITLFAGLLDAIEQTRTQRVRNGLQTLTQTLMDTAFALAPEVERIIEAESYELNIVVISNRKVYADLVARMATADVDIFVSAQLAWEAGQRRWRALRHNHAIAAFQSTLNSNTFTDPDERHAVLAQIRDYQATVHEQRRLAALQELERAGANLTSEHAQQIVAALSRTQRDEEEQSHRFFTSLLALHDAKTLEAQELREALRLELHGFGAMAPEGEIALARNTLAELLADDSLEDFFRMAGGLRTELDQIVKRLELKELIYADNLVPLRDSLQVLLSALPLETVMEAQGKGAARKAVHGTLEKIRKASKQEIMALLPALQAEVAVLHNISDMNSDFSVEMEAISMQLDAILQDHDALVNSPEGSIETSVGNESAASGEIPRPNTSVVSATGTIGSPMTATMRVQTVSAGSATSTTTIDLQAVRKVQRRLGMLVYASELTPALQTHLQFIAEQLTLQHRADAVVDSVVATSCDDLLDVRQHESRLFLDDLGQRIEHQSSTLHDHCEKLASFCLRVALCMEKNVDKVRIVNMSVMDLLDILKDNDDEAHAAMEDSFSKSCARLRHAPDNVTLRQEFQTAKDLLASMEAEYRLYQRRTQVAASHHVLAIDAQRIFFLGPLCESFGLKPPVNQPQTGHVPAPGEDPLNLERFLNAQCIEDITNPKPKDAEQGENGGTNLANEEIASHSSGQAIAVTSPRAEASQPHAAASGSGPGHGHEKVTKAAAAGAGAAAGRKPAAAPAPAAPVEPPPDLFHTSSGLELQVVHPIPELVQHVLTQKDEPDDHDQLEGGSNESPQEAADTKHTEESSELAYPPVLSESEQLAAEALTARKARVMEMVSRSFLELRIPDEVMDQLLICFRDGMLSRFDVHARETSALALTAHEACIEEGHRLLEERLRMHWPRKGRLEVQCYQPRVGELTSHTQRLDRHVRSLLKKVATHQVAFDSRVSDTLASIERSRVTFVGCNAQLPMQLSLAALQGLDVKFNKLLTVFRSESETQRQQLQSQTESELNAVAASAQDFVNACSAQLFPDLTGTDVMAGCDYHPLEIDALREQLATTETGIREQLALRSLSMEDLAEKQLQVLQLSSAFKARYQSCLQSLSMKDGLGQKYGLPRRSAQERYRSETTRCDERSAKIDELLVTLKSLSAGEKLTVPKEEEEGLSTRIVTMLLQLRAKMFARGSYFGLLKNQSQLEVTTVEYVVKPANGDAAEVVLRDRDLLAHDDLPPSISFLDFVQRVGVQCREETLALYQQEGKLDELPPNGGVPAALEEYLHAQKDKAMAYVLQQETKFRKQVEQLGDLLATAPEAALRDLCQRSQQTLEQSTVQLRDTMERGFENSMELKQKHIAELRPALFSPNQTAQLQELCWREEKRSVQIQSELRSFKTQVLTRHKACSHTLERDLLALTRCLVAVLDSAVMSLDDLQPVDGSDQLARAKRKSLTRLRKMARVLEFGDAREVPRSAKELETLTQLGESARFPRRAWPGIPSFGVDQQLWPAVQALQDEQDGANPDAAQPSSSEGDGACVALLTHAHRALVYARDAVYAQYVAFCRGHNAQLLALAQERLQDERKWAQSWISSIARMQQTDV